MRRSYTLGPNEIQEAVVEWLSKSVEVIGEVKITIITSGTDAGDNSIIDFSSAQELEVSWGEPDE